MKKSKFITMICLLICTIGLLITSHTYDKKHSDYFEPAKVTQQMEIDGSSEEYYKVTTTSQNLHYTTIGAGFIAIIYNTWAVRSERKHYE